MNGEYVFELCVYLSVPIIFTLHDSKSLFFHALVMYFALCRWLLLPSGKETSPQQPICLSRDESTGCIIGYGLVSFGSPSFCVV